MQILKLKKCTRLYKSNLWSNLDNIGKNSHTITQFFKFKIKMRAVRKGQIMHYSRQFSMHEKDAGDYIRAIYGLS